MSLPEHGTAPQPQTVSNGTFLPTPKQIKFISTDGQPHSKRRRINAACLTCRKRKTRCSGERPECKTCTDNAHVCAGYTEKATRKDTDKDGEEEDEFQESAPKRHKSSVAAPEPGPRPVQTSQHNGSSASMGSLRGGGRNAVDFVSPESTQTVGSGTALRHRVPFFRYFGPTAIVPGFKQMVVQLKDRNHRRSTHSISGESPASGQVADGSSVGIEVPPQDLAFYDATNPTPNPPLITHLCETFFTHLGCNYPFLQRERFMKDLEEKRVDAILVDAVCAIAARFSTDPSLSRPSDHSTPVDEKGEVKRAFKGQPYAQRAASSLVDTFGCPTIAVAQACLLLAYDEFGTDRDSGLWMFLGTSIRMSQDLGIQKLEGMQLEGRMGPTPKTVKTSLVEGKREEQQREAQQAKLTQALDVKEDQVNIDDRRASEQERIDTFWAVFFLDRAVSSGVGRPVTLRDKDIEISFPYRPNEKMISGHPHPFPIMIRIVHLYGRIADVINNIQGSSQVNPDGLKQLTAMEKDLTGIYQRMSPKLHFNATNFQHYVKAEQGTNFILLHFWFHTSIILLHQPTLLYSLDTKVQQLFPDSRELSISSAKTIADILAFAELIDVKSFIGNPFTSQPMYVAACAFLAEARAHASQPPSRQHSPPDRKIGPDVKPDLLRFQEMKSVMDSKAAAKHSLLATAANQNYQRCYKALKMLDSYWAGCRYILVALDQKAKGLMDPILFTQEDIDGEMPSIEPSFTQPGWRRSSHGPSPADRRTSIAWSPRMDWSQAIGWSLTGTTNSPAPNLSFLYPNPTSEGESNGQMHIQAKQQQPHPGHQPAIGTEVPPFGTNGTNMMPPPRNRMGGLPYDPVSAADADLLLGLHSPYSLGSQGLPQTQQAPTSSFNYTTGQPVLQPQQSQQYFSPSDATNTPGFSDMLIESQDIDMSHQFQGDSFSNLNFPGGDMIWLEYLPPDVLSYFSQNGDPSQMVMPSGPGPPPGSS